MAKISNELKIDIFCQLIFGILFIALIGVIHIFFHLNRCSAFFYAFISIGLINYLANRFLYISQKFVEKMFLNKSIGYRVYHKKKSKNNLKQSIMALSSNISANIFWPVSVSMGISAGASNTNQDQYYWILLKSDTEILRFSFLSALFAFFFSTLNIEDPLSYEYAIYSIILLLTANIFRQMQYNFDSRTLTQKMNTLSVNPLLTFFLFLIFELLYLYYVYIFIRNTSAIASAFHNPISLAPQLLFVPSIMLFFTTFGRSVWNLQYFLQTDDDILALCRKQIFLSRYKDALTLLRKISNRDAEFYQTLFLLCVFQGKIKISLKLLKMYKKKEGGTDNVENLLFRLIQSCINHKLKEDKYIDLFANCYEVCHRRIAYSFCLIQYLYNYKRFLYHLYVGKQEIELNPLNDALISSISKNNRFYHKLNFSILTKVLSINEKDNDFNESYINKLQNYRAICDNNNESGGVRYPLYQTLNCILMISVDILKSKNIENNSILQVERVIKSLEIPDQIEMLNPLYLFLIFLGDIVYCFSQKQNSEQKNRNYELLRLIEEKAIKIKEMI